MAGLGYRREMADWDMSAIIADFFEVAPENWIRRDLAPLVKLLNSGRPINLHGVSLNLGGTSPINRAYLQDLSTLITDLNAKYFSDHLAASGDAHQLFDLFPIPFTKSEVRRVGDRIRRVQDFLGFRIAVENTTWYTNIGAMTEADFLAETADYADCDILLDLNNISVNHKNHGGMDIAAFVACIDIGRVTYLHVAGHEFDERLDMFLDTHSQPVELSTVKIALAMHHQYAIPILLEWDNDVPNIDTINQELSCLQNFTTT